MSVWRPSPIPAQLSAGIAALLTSSVTPFIPQIYSAQLMGTAGVRASALPTQQRGFQPQLYPQPANPAIPLRPDAQAMALANARPAPLPIAPPPFNPALISGSQFNPSLLGGPVAAQRAAVAYCKPTAMPFQPYPMEPELLDWYEADGAVGLGNTQEAVHAAYQKPATPTQGPRFNPALFLAVPSAPPLDNNGAQRAAALFRSQAMPAQQWPRYHAAFDGPYQNPPIVFRIGIPETARPSLPAQAAPFPAAVFAGAPIALPPAQAPYPYHALWRAPAQPLQAGVNYLPAFDGPYQAPPIAIGSLTPIATRQGLPAQGAPFNFALLSDAPPSPAPYPYSALYRASSEISQRGSRYLPAFDGPYQVPPLTLIPSPITRAPAFHSQALPMNAALLAVQIDPPPIQSPFTSPALDRPVPLRTQAPSLNPALFVGPQVDVPPLASIAGMPAPPVRLQILPVQKAPFSVALLPSQVDAPPLTQPYPYIAIARVIPLPVQARMAFPMGSAIPDAPPITGFVPPMPARPAPLPTQAFPGYLPAFDGPYQAPPIVAFAQAITRAIGMPLQARFDIAPFIGPPIPPPPLPIQVAVYARAIGIPMQAAPISPSLLQILNAPPITVLAQPLFSIGKPFPQQAQPFQVALFLAPDAPPLCAIASMPPPLFKPWILPAQGRPFNVAFLPIQVDAPPLVMPFPYVSLARPIQGPRHAPMAYPLFLGIPPTPPQPSQLYAVEDYFLLEIRAQDYFF